VYDSGFGRLIGVLVSPGKTFESIARRPTWLVPLLVLVAVGAGVFGRRASSSRPMPRAARAPRGS
jgi:hypothetical protein